MEFKKSRICFALCFVTFLAVVSRAENLVGYSVNTGCTDDWDISVNGVTIVRHRPTGFGRCIYNGSINQAVTNGWNKLSLSRVGTKGSSHKPENGGCLSIMISYASDYRGQRDMGDVQTVLNYKGSDQTNLLFTVEGEISNIAGGIITDVGAPLFMNTPVFRAFSGIFLLFINIYGFFMVVNDHGCAKKRQARISEGHFVWNALLGGGAGQLFGMFSKRHNTDKTILTVGIPMLILLQIAAVVFFTTSSGRRLASRISGPRYHPSINAIFENTSGFLNSLKPTDGDALPK